MFLVKLTRPGHLPELCPQSNLVTDPLIRYFAPKSKCDAILFRLNASDARIQGIIRI